MDLKFLILGILALTITTADILKTTLSSNGGGMITNTVGKSIWKLAYAVARGDAKAGVLNYAGVASLLAVLVAWVIGLWSGLFFLLLADPGSIISSNGSPTGPLEKLYYAGFSLSTLGVGDYKASSDIWRLVTSTSAFTGLVLMTTSVTYFVPILSAVSLQNKISLYIQSMGRTPQELLQHSWNGSNFSAFSDASTELVGMLQQHTLQHHSYPVLHYFHNTNPSLSVKRSVVQMAEAYYILRYALPSYAAADPMKLLILGNTLDAYLETVGKKYVNPRSEEQLPTPDLNALKDVGLSTSDIWDSGQGFPDEVQERRKLFGALLKQDGWTWQHVYPQEAA